MNCFWYWYTQCHPPHCVLLQVTCKSWMAETEGSETSSVGHHSGLAVAVSTQICMSVLVALGQVRRAGDWGEPEPGSANCKLSNHMRLQGWCILVCSDKCTADGYLALAILKDLELTLEDLSQICRLAGTRLCSRGLVPQSRLSVPDKGNDSD